MTTTETEGRTTLADMLRARLREYDETLATPGQAQDIAEVDLADDVQTIVERERQSWRGGVAPASEGV